MNQTIQEIRNHKDTVSSNNEIIIELLTEMVEPDAVANSYILSMTREQNRLLKIIINELKEKLKG
jgi:hypothetical protein